jgi:hypothetical protein
MKQPFCRGVWEGCIINTSGMIISVVSGSDIIIDRGENFVFDSSKISRIWDEKL